MERKQSLSGSRGRMSLRRSRRRVDGSEASILAGMPIAADDPVDEDSRFASLEVDGAWFSGSILLRHDAGDFNGSGRTQLDRPGEQCVREGSLREARGA